MKYLIIFIPITFLCKYFFPNDFLIFFSSAIGLIALSGFLGESIETISDHTSVKMGSLINATLGNAAELIFTIIALKAGQIALVKGAIIGALLGNLLLLPALSMIIGGIKNGRQYFNKEPVSANSTMMTLAVVGFILPTIFEILREAQNHHAFKMIISDNKLETYSLGIACVLMLVYLLSLVFSFTQKEDPEEKPVPVSKSEEDDKTKWSLTKGLVVMAVSTILLILVSDILVSSVDPVIHSFNLSPTFLGIILIPILSDVAEHVVAVQQAYKNKMDLSLSITLESATQIALFVAPLLIFIAFFLGKSMTLFFGPLEVVVLGLSIYLVTKIAEDGECNWFEGVQLIIVYVMAALGFYFM